MIDFLKENAVVILTVTIPSLAPVATALINKYGTTKHQERWAIIRNIYRKALLMKKAPPVRIKDQDFEA